jgi:glycosyl transferase family 25
MQIDTLKKYVINLKRRPDRLLNFYEIFPFYDYEIVYGFDGKNYENETAEEKEMFDRFTNNLNHGEKGCFISHMRIYRDIVEKNIPYAMILEDDPILCENFKERLTKVVGELPDDFNIFYFGGRFTPEFKMDEGSYIRITDNIVAHNPSNIDLTSDNHNRGAFGYIISNSFAKAIVTLFKLKSVSYIPVDHWILQYCIFNRLEILNSYPLLCHSPASSPDSDIRGKNT